MFSCDQAALRTLLSDRLSVRPSVCHTVFTMFPSSYHHEIIRSYYQWQKWCPCKRSRSEVKCQGNKCQYLIQPFLGCNSSSNSHMTMKWCCLGEAPYCFSIFNASLKFQGHTAQKSSILTQIGCFRSVTPVWIHPWLSNDAQSLM